MGDLWATGKDNKEAAAYRDGYEACTTRLHRSSGMLVTLIDKQYDDPTNWGLPPYWALLKGLHAICLTDNNTARAGASSTGAISLADRLSWRIDFRGFHRWTWKEFLRFPPRYSRFWQPGFGFGPWGDLPPLLPPLVSGAPFLK